MSDPSDAPTPSAIQQEVADRRRCYQEALVRHLYLRIETFERDHGWVDKNYFPTEKKMFYVSGPGDDASEAEKQAWNSLPLEQLYIHGLVMVMEGNTATIPTACDILDYKPPPGVPRDSLTDHPVVVTNPDGSVTYDFFQSIARLDLARADPKRQAELFGWTIPDPAATLFDVAAFEESKAAYWGHVCASAFDHLDTLKDTADFKASELIRLLYLAGELPEHLRSTTAHWRNADDFERDVNFSFKVEARITKALLEFKFWVDDPFFVNGAFHNGDRVSVIKAKRRSDAMGKWPRLSPEDVEKAVNDEIDDDEKPEEMTFWSENHQLLFASAEYLAGQWLRDDVFRAGLPHREEGPTGTRPGDKTGELRMRSAKPRLLRWLADRMRLGFSEWNALPYYEEDIEPLLNLIDFCLDEEIRSRAEIVLDLLLFDVARFAHNGNFAPTSGRCYANQKMCGYEPGIGDLVEILFGTRRGVIVWGGATSAGAFASSRRYVVPDVLIRIGQDRPWRLIDRSRVSLRFDEAAPYGAGFETFDDAMFWWSRSSYVTKQVVRLTKRIASLHHLAESGPFLALLPTLGTVATVAKPLTLLTSDPGEVDVVDTLSPLTEGSALTRANQYTYRNRNAMLSSVQNFRAGQFNAQTNVCQATLSPGATVWTTHPSAGATLSAILLFAAGGGIIGGLLGGPIGGVVGAWAGGVVGTIAKPGGFELIPAGSDGPNWWTGSASLPRVIQRDGAAIIAYQPGELLRRLLGDKTHAWFPKRAFDTGSVVQQSGNCNVSSANWTFGRVGDGYVGLLSAREVKWTTLGPWADKELVADDGRNIFIIQVGNADEFGSYEQFKDKVSGARVHVNGLRLMTADFQCSYDLPSPGGGRLELHIDDDEVRYNGVRFSDDNFPRYETPYVKCGRVAWGQYQYTIAFGGNSLTHDFSELKTKVEGAMVRRSIDSLEHDCELDRVWVVSNRGARRVFPENTIEACRHAVENEHAMGLLVDACLTADGEVVLWHDWNPDDFFAILRQIGGADMGAYRPTVPDADDDLRRETSRLTLAQLRFAYGYELISAPSGTGPAPFVVPTLGDLLLVAKEWTDLRHLLINVAMPADRAAEFGGEMLRAIVTSVGVGVPFDVTLLIAAEEVLIEMKAYAADAASLTTIKFSSMSVARGAPVNEDGSTDFAARDAAIRESSAVASAIRNRTAVATIGRSFTMAEAFDNDYYRFVAYDLERRDSFNLNPRENQGHQVERLLGRAADNPVEMQGLIEIGMSGIITDDVPVLRGVIAQLRRI